MKQSDFFKRFEELQSQCLDLAKKKNHDYAGDEDALDNFRDFGAYGVIVRLGDKYKRVKHFTKSRALLVMDESIRDTLMDLANYAIIAMILLEEE